MFVEIDDFLEYLRADRGYSAKTVQRYQLPLTRIAQYAQRIEENMTWSTLHPDLIRKWQIDLQQEGLSARTMQCHFSALRSFYKYLILRGTLNVNPMERINNPKADKKLPTYLRESEMDRLFNDVHFEDTYEGQRNRLILLTFYHTGMRLSELIGLNLHAFDIEQKQVKVLGKRNKERIIPFGEELAKAIEQYNIYRQTQTAMDEKALFVNKKGKRISQREVQDIVHYYLSFVTTQKKRSPHVLRHTFATTMLNNGADIEAVRQLLGHESLAATEVYTHTSLAELKKAHQKAHPRG